MLSDLISSDGKSIGWQKLADGLLAAWGIFRVSGLFSGKTSVPPEFQEVSNA